jgi:RNA polymerase sigma factor (sigma-70 family)
MVMEPKPETTVATRARIPVVSARRGDVAFSDFYRVEHAGQVRRAALLLGSDEVANDVVHDAFTAMYRRWETITDPGPYLNRAVLNGCRDVGRRPGADRRLIRRLPPREQPDHHEILLDVVRRLPFNQRAAIVLRFYAGMTEREIAITLDVPVGSVGPWINRALATMKKELS